MKTFTNGNIILGNEYAQDVRNNVKVQAEALLVRKITPCLVVILLGENPASKIYVANKKKFAIECGMKSFDIILPEATTQSDLIAEIAKLNNDPFVHGILVQMPLPKHINANAVINAINPRKDVDGFHIQNMGQLFTNTTNENSLLPCTPKGCMWILESLEQNLRGKYAVIIGSSNIVGKPMAAMLLNKGATVSVLNSATKNKELFTKNADIIVLACGVPNMLHGDDISNPIILDVGINRLSDGKIVGDCDFESCQPKARFITTVPRGIGPMTIAMLLQNTITSCLSQTL